MADPVTNVNKEPGMVLGFVERAMRILFGVTRNWERHPSLVRNNYELGMGHLAAGSTSDAILRFSVVTWLEPQHADAWYYLGCSYLAAARVRPAQKAFRRALALRPGHPETLYMLAIALGKAAPKETLPRLMPLALVEAHFNALAADYAHVQLEEAAYEGHVLLAAAIRARIVPGRVDHEILDIGAGTGLAGAQLRDIAQTLTGLDISAPMLERAKLLQDEDGKKTYDMLLQRDAASYLAGVPDASLDIIMAADVMGYIGELEPIFTHAARTLKPAGLLAFTADKLEGDGADFMLDTSAGRFRFSRAYLEALARAHGLRELTFDDVPVYPGQNAWLCVFTK